MSNHHEKDVHVSVPFNSKFDLIVNYMNEAGKADLLNGKSEIVAFRKLEEAAASVIEVLENVPEARDLIRSAPRLLHTSPEVLRKKIGDEAYLSKSTRQAAELKAKELFDSLELIDGEIDRALLNGDADKATMHRRLKYNMLLDSDWGAPFLQQAMALPAAKKSVLRKANFERLRNEIMQANLRLVLHMSKRYKAYGLDTLDLIQEGNLGLMRAVQKFDWRLGYRFSTYATWWIKQAISRFIADRKTIVRVPSNNQRVMNKIRKEMHEHELLHGEVPAMQDLKSAKGQNCESLAAMFLASEGALRLDSSSFEDGVGSSIIESFIDETTPSPEETFQVKEALEKISSALSSVLTPKEKQVILLRFGLVAEEEPMTLEAVGAMMDLTRERIRQIEVGALTRLRKAYKRLDPLREML